MEDYTPRQIVELLDKYIIGQDEAKRAVAVALRNRYRRKLLAPEMRDEIMPKNIIMIGPTGVGKTEIARRLAKLVKAPFIKVEATKFTEVGYVGRDVESMIRELVETSIRMVKSERMSQVKDEAERLANQRLLDIVIPPPHSNQRAKNPFEVLFGGARQEADESVEKDQSSYRQRRAKLKEKLEAGELENTVVEIEVEDKSASIQFIGNSGIEEMGINVQDLFGNLFPAKKKKRRVTVAEARKILSQEEAQKLIDMDEVISEAIKRTEESGIIFLDEIDKIAGSGHDYGPDVSREGVQRDILPIVEGSTVMTKYGPVKTDFILFIAAGAFHVSKPSDLIPELQGRFPIRVELDSLDKDDLKRILVEPKNSLVKQYTALLAAEQITLKFDESAIDEIADIACKVNQSTEDIGARRLHTIMEKLLEDLSFDASDLEAQEVVIDRQYVRDRLKDIVQDQDLSRFIL